MYAFSGGYDSSICACAFGIIGSTMAITAATMMTTAAQMTAIRLR